MLLDLLGFTTLDCKTTLKSADSKAPFALFAVPTFNSFISSPNDIAVDPIDLRYLVNLSITMVRFIHADKEPLKASKQDNKPGLQVLAAGLSRCSTSSLHAAFEDHLDLSPAMHGSNIMPHLWRLKLVAKTFAETRCVERRTMLHELYNGYVAAADMPGYAFLDDLLEMYPDMKVILNKRRDAETWLRSAKGALKFYSTWEYFLITCLVPQSFWHWKLYRNFGWLMRQRLGVQDIWSVEMYQKHNDWITQIGREKKVKILEWEASDGWEPLCEFLGRPVPDVPFPSLNEAKENQARDIYLVRRGLLAWSAVIAIIVALALSHKQAAQVFKIAGNS